MSDVMMIKRKVSHFPQMSLMLLVCSTYTRDQSVMTFPNNESDLMGL